MGGITCNQDYLGELARLDGERQKNRGSLQPDYAINENSSIPDNRRKDNLSPEELRDVSRERLRDYWEGR